MANLKNITELPVAESADGLNLIVNDGGSAKQIAASAVGAQADWAEMDETSPAFIKNKPVEEWDLDFAIIGTFVVTDEENGTGEMNFEYTVNSINTFENIKNKILSGVQPKCKVKETTTGFENTDTSLRYTESFNTMYSAYYPANALGDGSPELIRFISWGCNTAPYLILSSDNTILGVGDDN